MVNQLLVTSIAEVLSKPHNKYSLLHWYESVAVSLAHYRAQLSERYKHGIKCQLLT
jgi:hypothetical protein